MRGLYKGMGLSLLLVVPYFSISFTAYDQLKVCIDLPQTKTDMTSDDKLTARYCRDLDLQSHQQTAMAFSKSAWPFYTKLDPMHPHILHADACDPSLGLSKTADSSRRSCVFSDFVCVPDVVVGMLLDELVILCLHCAATFTVILLIIECGSSFHCMFHPDGCQEGKVA